MSLIGNRCKLYRVEHTLTQPEMARLVGTSAPTIARLERGNEYVSERIFMRILKLVDPKQHADLLGSSIEADLRLEKLDRKNFVMSRRNGWTQGTYGLKKYGIGFKKRRELIDYLIAQGLRPPRKKDLKQAKVSAKSDDK